MKNLTKKDLELNPNVVTGLTGSGEQPKGNTDACQGTATCNESVGQACSLGENNCEHTKLLASCNVACATDNCSENNCTETQTCFQCGTVVCGTSYTLDIQCCDTVQGDVCNNDTNFLCPATDGCESTTVVCDASDDCPPVVPAETIGC